MNVMDYEKQSSLLHCPNELPPNLTFVSYYRYEVKRILRVGVAMAEPWFFAQQDSTALSAKDPGTNAINILRV